jgi:hypothetical protein
VLQHTEESKSQLPLIPRDCNRKASNLQNAMVIDQVPHFQSICQGTLCHGRLYGKAAVRLLVEKSCYSRCEPVTLMSGDFKASQRRHKMRIEIRCKECGKKYTTFRNICSVTKAADTSIVDTFQAFLHIVSVISCHY